MEDLNSQRRTKVFVNDLKKYTPPKATQQLEVQATANNSTVVDDELVGRGVGAGPSDRESRTTGTTSTTATDAATGGQRSPSRESVAPSATARVGSDLLPSRRWGRPPKAPHLQGRVRGLPNIDGSNAVPSHGQGHTKPTDGSALRLPGGRGNKNAHPITTSDAAPNRPRTRARPPASATAPAPARPATAIRRGRGRPRKAQL